MGDSDSDSNDGLNWSALGNSTCLDWHNNPDAVWPYCPSLAAAVIFTTLFGTSTTAHLVQAIMYRKRFCWIFVFAGAWETIGFAIRSAGTQFQLSLALFTPQQILILLGPLLINAFIYMVFGRMVLFFIPEQKVGGIKARRLSLYFVLLDVFSFLIQATGGSMLSGTDANQISIGMKVYMGGMGLQQGFLTCFIVLTILFYRKMNAIENTRQTEWRVLLYIVYASIILITVRIIFRFVEFSSGFDGPIPHTESIFYILDAVPMATIVVAFNLYHPGRVLVGPESEFPKMSKKEKKEVKKMEKMEKRTEKEEKRRLKQEKEKGGYGVLHDSADTMESTAYGGAHFEESTVGLPASSHQDHRF